MDTKILLGELKEFRRYMTSELAELKKEVRSLSSLKWKLLGASGTVAFLASLLVELIRH